MNVWKTFPAALMATITVFTAADAPGAFAQNRRDIRVTFAFNPADSAETIYSNLQRAARRACEFRGSRSLTMDRFEKACAKEILDAGVAQLARPDIAALHNRNAVTANAGSRG